MGRFEWKPEWVQILARQEETLRYAAFSREDALELGLKIIQLVQDRGWGAAAIRIVEDNTTIFSYKMPGTSAENDWWMDRKLAVSRRGGCCSLRAYVEAEAGLREAFWEARPANFAACGGCFPVLMGDGTAPWAYVLVSGLAHYHDHQVIADAMSWQLHREIPSVAD